MTRAVDMLGLEGKGDFGKTKVTELLGSLEAVSATVRIWLETEIGVGQLALHQGQIVFAEVGPLRKRTALLRILTLAEGTYSIEEVRVDPGPPIVASVGAALRILSDRQQDWRVLCESSPPMSSVLRLSLAGREAQKTAVGIDRIVFTLVDGRRSVMDILGESELDPVEALRTIVRGVELGCFEDIESSASLLPLPIEEISGEVAKMPSSQLAPCSSTPRGHAGGQRRSVLDGVRKETIVGIGWSFADSAKQAPRSAAADSLQASPIIDLGGEARESEAGVAVGAIRSAGAGPKSYREPRTEISDEPASIADPADSLLDNAKALAGALPPSGEARVRHVGRYEIIARIGRGGMGSVYLARLTARVGFSRLFALKLLRSYLTNDPNATEAFLAEARLAGQLHHPNVVGVVDAGVHQQQVYLVMDYVEGCSLKQLMAAHSDHRPPRLIVPIILGALEGLGAVHGLRADNGTPLNVVHCDISPENLLVGTDGICRLTDFGVARQARTEKSSRSIHGKPGYVAPEQVSGSAIDHRVDLFALGVVLWSALTGERLFLGGTVEETLHQVRHQPIAPPSTVGLRPHSAFDAICLKALERDPSRRYASAEQMQFELREAAMAAGLIGLNSEVASWVRRTVGPQLSQRRLLILEASRPREQSIHDHDGDDTAAPLSQQDDAPLKLSSSPPPVRGFGEVPEEPGSRTMRLDPVEKPGRGKQIALVLAAILAAAMVLVAIAWPAALNRLLRIDSTAAVDTAESRGISIGVAPNPSRPNQRSFKSQVAVPATKSSSGSPAGDANVATSQP